MTLLHKGIILIVIGLVLGNLASTFKYDGTTVIFRIIMVVGLVLTVYGLIKKV